MDSFFFGCSYITTHVNLIMYHPKDYPISIFTKDTS
jgi:hypothetical protein